MVAALPGEPGQDHPPAIAKDDISPNAKVGAREWMQAALVGEPEFRAVKTFAQRGGMLTMANPNTDELVDLLRWPDDRKNAKNRGTRCLYCRFRRLEIARLRNAFRCREEFRTGGPIFAKWRC